MTATLFTYPSGRVLLGSGLNWSAANPTFGVLLAGLAYEPHPDHAVVADIDDELAGVGYARKELANRALVRRDLEGRVDCEADAVTWTGLDTAERYRFAIVYRFGTNDADSPLIQAIDFGPAGISLAGIGEHALRWDGQAARGRVFSIR